MRYISAIFIMIAAICKSISDTIEFHFYTSVFKNLNQNFWNPEKSWNHAKRIFAYPLDAWHISNSLALSCFLLAMIFYINLTPIKNQTLSKIVDFTLLSIISIAVFNLFFNHLLN